jgi:predicted transcriptional regulator
VSDFSTKVRSYYECEAQGLPPARMRVMEIVLRAKGPLSRHDISKIGYIPLQSVCGRVNELLSMGFLEVVGEKSDENTEREVELVYFPSEIKSIKQIEKTKEKSMLVRLREIMSKTEGVSFGGKIYSWDEVFKGCQ